jgi:Domain of unknown function (DUF5664)
MSDRPNEDAQAEYLRTHADTAKPSNPKDAFGSAKVPTGLVPDTALVEMALAFLEGGLKYGRYNWRVVGVRASIYNDAMDRHRKKWWNGQDRDPSTRVRELASVMACCAILIDSEICGVLEDDRPPLAPLGPLLDANMELVAHLKELFKEHNPHQYTWADSPAVVAAMGGLGAGPLEPEGFPGGYAAAPTEEQPDGTVTFVDPKDLPPNGPRCVEPPVSAVHFAQPLELPCGCIKRCKGHEAAAPAYIVENPTVAPNYAAERAQSTTADAEFPRAPRAATFEAFSESIRGIPDISDTREFDPGD